MRLFAVCSRLWCLSTLVWLYGCSSGFSSGTVPVPLADIAMPTGSYQLVSQLGCAKQDVDLNTGKGIHGGTATDDGPCINAALAKATAAHPVVLVQDGASLVSGVHGPAAGNWSIYGQGGGFSADGNLMGTGFFQKAGTNDDVIHNGGPGAGCPYGVSDPGSIVAGPPPARGAHITLHNFVINGNRGNGTDGNSTHGVSQGISNLCWYMGIDMMDMDDVDISGITFYNTSSYNLRFSNVGSSNIDHSIFANTGPHPLRYVAQNGDGAHINGPANDIVISNNLYATTDDAIALNAPEGWGGLIQNITIKDSTVTQGGSMIRLYTLSAPAAPGHALPEIKNVTIDNYNGVATTCGSFGFPIASDRSRANTISGVTWTNSICSADWGNLLQENVGDITFSNYTWRSRDLPVGFMNALIVPAQASKLTFNEVTIQRSGSARPTTLLTASMPWAFYPTVPVLIGDISINGLNVVGAHLNDVLHLVSPSTVDSVEATGIDPADFSEFTNDPAAITALHQF